MPADPAFPGDLDYRLLFEESPDVLLVLLPDAPRYTMVAATNARLRLTHTTRETLGRGLFEVFPDNPDDPGATGSSNLRASLERVLRTRQPDTMSMQKYDIRGPDGQFQVRYWSPKNLPVIGANGDLVYILHRVEDVTELVRASELGEQLRGRHRDLEREIEQRAASVDALTAENARRQISERRLEAQLHRMRLLDHITRAVAERQDEQSIFQVVVRNVEGDLPADFCRIRLVDSLASQSPLPTELVYEPQVAVTSSPLIQHFAQASLSALVVAPLHAEEHVFGVLMVGRRQPHSFSSAECEFLRQLAEHVALAVRQGQLHESLRTAYEDLRLSQRTLLQQERLSALGQMASGIAHDINNAISPVALYVESLLQKDPELSPRARQYLPVVLRAIDDVAATVARMREFYRPRDAQITLLPVQLNDMVEQVLELTRARWSDMPQQRGAVIEIVRELAADLPQVPGIEGELREALTNLIFNAVDAMPRGGQLRLSTAAMEDQILLRIADTGIGMDEDTRRKCLEPFFTTKGERGTGLGLAMVYGALQRHGADIGIDSTPGAGTTFTLSFPRWRALAPPPPAADSAAAPVLPLHILIVDDDPLVLESLREALEVEGHSVVAANDPREALELFRAHQPTKPFEVVITDLGMPHLDGRAVAQAVKQSSPGTPVLLLTGWGQRLEGTGTLEHVDRVLAKPPKMRELREALSQLR